MKDVSDRAIVRYDSKMATDHINDCSIGSHGKIIGISSHVWPTNWPAKQIQATQS